MGYEKILNDDYSELYKYAYLRNWGIFLSLIGGIFWIKRINKPIQP